MFEVAWENRLLDKVSFDFFCCSHKSFNGLTHRFFNSVFFFSNEKNKNKTKTKQKNKQTNREDLTSEESIDFIQASASLVWINIKSDLEMEFYSFLFIYNFKLFFHVD